MWPLYIAYALIVIATGMAWIFVVGGFAVGIGFAAAGVLKLVQKRWWSGVACAVLAAGSLFLAYAYYAGMITI